MKIEILTIFPEIFSGFISSSLIKKAQDKERLTVRITDIRSFAPAPHKHVDDTPYGGGAGMVMKPEPLIAAIEDAKTRLPAARVILLSPSGKLYNQERAREISREPELILICGRYEGVDQRVIDLAVDLELSIGDYVLMGGEVAAMAVIESAARLIEDVVGNAQSLHEESFSIMEDNSPMLEGPHYTRPAEFRGLTVPGILLCGDHKKIQKWRLEEARKKTLANRPDLKR